MSSNTSYGKYHPVLLEVPSIKNEKIHASSEVYELKAVQLFNTA